MSNRLAIAPAAAIFSAELAEARRLGFQLQLNVTPNAVGARMQPRTARAHAACERASGKTGQAIESTAALTEGQDHLDVVRETIRSVITRAAEVTT